MLGHNQQIENSSRETMGPNEPVWKPRNEENWTHNNARERKKCTYEKGKNKMKKKTTEENKKLENQTKSTKSKNAHARHIG